MEAAARERAGSDGEGEESNEEGMGDVNFEDDAVAEESDEEEEKKD